MYQKLEVGCVEPACALHILIKVHQELWTQENTHVLLLDNCSKLRLHFVAREMGVLQSVMLVQLEGASIYGADGA